MTPIAEIKTQSGYQILEMLLPRIELEIGQGLVRRHAAADSGDQVADCLAEGWTQTALRTAFKGIEQVFPDLAPAAKQTGQLQDLQTLAVLAAKIEPFHSDLLLPGNGRH